MKNLKRIAAKLIIGVFCITSIISTGTIASGESKDTGQKHKHQRKGIGFESKLMEDEKENREIIVKYKNKDKGESIKSSIQSKLSASPFTIKKRLKKDLMEVLKIGENDDVDEIIKEFESNPDVEYVQPNYRLKLHSATEEPRFIEQWGLNNTGKYGGTYGFDVQVIPAWEKTMGSSEVIVGIIDTGIDINHPDLADNIYRNPGEIPYNSIDDDYNGYIDDVTGWDFFNRGGNVFDSEYLDDHGTHVAGIVAASHNGQGVVGVAPNVKILPLRVNDDEGYIRTDAAVEAIQYARSLGAKIVNCSWGSGWYNEALYSEMSQSDMIFVCAAGNNSTDIFSTPDYPSSYNLSNVVTVAAVDRNGNLAEFSNYGSNVDVAAPGVDILSTLPLGKYGYKNGTSMAAPFVTGAFALLKSYYPQMSSSHIINRLKENLMILEPQHNYATFGGTIDMGAVFDNSNKRYESLSGYIPTGFDTSTTRDSITLLWDVVQGVDSYEVEIDNSIQTVTQATYYEYDGLSAGSSHMFRVRSIHNDDRFPWSDVVIESTLDPGKGTGLLAEYYDNMDLTDYLLSALDETIDFDWGTGSPNVYMEEDTFSVRWTGQVEPKYSEEYTFYTNAGDGVRLWVDDQLIVDEWKDKGIIEASGTISLEADRKYDIKMEYYESLGSAKAQLWWSSEAQSKEIVPSNHLYPHQTGEKWKSKSVMPTPRYYIGLTELNGEIYVAGGGTFNSYMKKTVEKYNPASDSWSYVKELPYPSIASAMATLNGKVNNVGGLILNENDNYVFTSDIYALSPDSQSWYRVGNMSSPRAGMGVAELNGKLYVIGGQDDESYYLDKVEVYDPQTGSCFIKASIPTARSGLSVAAVNGKIYAIGGYGGDGYLNTVEEYDPSTNRWTHKSSMQIPRESAAVAVVNGKIYVMGGVVYVPAPYNRYLALDIVEEYDPQTDTWSIVESMPTERYGFGAAAVGNKIYAIGGYNDYDYYLNKVEEYTPPVQGPKDTISPVIALDQTNCTVNQAVYGITGSVDEAATVKINGNIVAFNDDLTFSSSVPLTSTHNNLLVEAIDLSGNRSASSVTITYDAASDNTAPILTLNQSGATVDYPTYVVSGELSEYSVVKINNEVVSVSPNLTFSRTITLNPGSNVIKVEAIDGAQNKAEESITVVYNPLPTPTPYFPPFVPPVGGDMPVPALTPGTNLDSGTIRLKPVLNKDGIATAKIETDDLNKAADMIVTSDGIKTVKVEVLRVSGTVKYNCILPAEALSSGQNNKRIEIKTEIGNITLPDNMFDMYTLSPNDEVTVSIGFADISGLNVELKKEIADRPVIELNVFVNGKAMEWNNPEAPVEVSMDYDAKDYELKDYEFIGVWYISDEDNIKAVPSGKYSKSTKRVTFTTTHFSKYAVGFIMRSFDDLGKYDWARKQIEVLASKGIINGKSEGTFAPGSNITRADFMILLVKALGFNANVKSNFDDVKETDYFYEAVGIAKALGITSGVGNNKFLPEEQIKREDMMVLVEKALNIAGKVKTQGDASDIAGYEDEASVSGYAVKSIATLVKEQIVTGSGNHINPKSNTTRAEVAALIYKIYNK